MALLADANLPLRTLANPGITQSIAIAALQNALGGTVEVVDPNNGWITQLDMTTSVTAQMVRGVEAKFDGLYAKRATMASELHNHMSDYDYLRATASPATLQMRLTLDRDALLAQALNYNSDYKRVVIPETTTFTVGTHRFGIYYPIVLRINVRTGTVLAVYDTDTANPLFTLASNLVESVPYTRNGLNLIDIAFPVYQFSRARYARPVTLEQGYSETFDFSDKFYAARAFTYINGAWRELGYTLSENVYDRAVPTLKIEVRDDTKKLKLSIPQIYISQGLIGKKLKLEIYTTEGAMDTVFTTAEVGDANCDFDLTADTTSPFAAVLQTLATKILVPMQDHVAGGSNGMSFEELRTAVVNGTLYDQLPVSPLQLQQFVQKQGFTLTKYLDNITDRIYYANRKMTGGANGTVPMTVANIELAGAKIAEVSSILSFTDHIITVLPTTLYRYIATNNSCVPLGDGEVQRLSAMTPTQLTAELNTTPHTRSPLHIVAYTGDTPYAKTYNLASPTADRITFVDENANATAQMSLASARIDHLDHGTGGYSLLLGVIKTVGLTSANESLLGVVLSATDKAGRTVYLTASKIGATATVEVYEALIPTDYHITSDGYFRTTLQTASGADVTCDLALTTTFTVRFLAHADLLPGVDNDAALVSGVPDAYSGWIGLVRQTVQLTFGTDLSNGIYNITDAVWTAQEYLRYATDVPYTYEQDVYQYKTVDGVSVLDYTVVDGKPQLIKLHAKGDAVLDAEGNPVIRYEAGTFKRDANNQLIVASERQLTYFVQALQLDARLYASEAAADAAYVDALAGEIADYVATVKTMANSLLEQTRLYFSPTRTMGNAAFSVGNATSVRFDLGLAFAVKLYVPDAVIKDDQLLEVIRTTVRTIIESHVTTQVVSLTAMSQDIKTALGDNVTAVDVLGINGTASLQTLLALEGDTSPIVAQKLVVKTDGTLALEKDITVEFALDS